MTTLRNTVERYGWVAILLHWLMAALIEAIELKRKMYFEFEDAPYHCLDVEVSKPTARGGQTLVRLKNLGNSCDGKAGEPPLSKGRVCG